MPQADPALTRAVRSASSKRVIDRLARRVRTESADSHSPAMRVAARILSPEKGDPTDIQALADLLGVGDSVAAIEASLDQALAARLAGHPQMQATAVRWLVNNAKISVLSVKDSHTESASASEEHDEESAHAVPGSSVGDVEAAATSTGATAEVAAVKSVDSFGANLLPTESQQQSVASAAEPSAATTPTGANAGHRADTRRTVWYSAAR
jgi:protein Tex